MKDARKTAYCYLRHYGLRAPRDGEEQIWDAALQQEINTVPIGSAGRLFDAVAAVLGVASIFLISPLFGD